MQKLCAFLGVSDRSPQKKLNMFLRWMIRRDSAVDFGIWRRMSPADLIIPLDTHVCRVAFLLGLINNLLFVVGCAVYYAGTGRSVSRRSVSGRLRTFRLWSESS